MLDGGEAVRRMVLNLARYSGIAPLLAGRMGGLGAILMLHRVTDKPSRPLGINRHLAISPAFLDASIAQMKRLGYKFVSMDEMIDAIRVGRCQPRHATITFDDAYRDNLEEALPILEKHDAPFAIYVSPGLTSRKADLWWDVLEEIVTVSDEVRLPIPEGDIVLDCSTAQSKIAANKRLHDYLTTKIAEEQRQPILREMARQAGIDHAAPSVDTLMDWDEVRRIAVHPLATIGAHTMNHYNLKRLPAETAMTEMADSARLIETETGARPRHFAYPYGYASAVGEREVKLAADSGFASAVTTRHGVLHAGHAEYLHALPRISMNGRYQDVGHLRTMLSGLTTPLANSGKSVVTV